MERPHFVATPWRDGSELLELRRWFYGGNSGAKGNGEADRRRDGVDKVLAWRVRKPELPLLLDSTADLVDAVLQDEAGLEASALRLVYAAAVARFITGLTDTTLDLRRSRPHWHIPPSSFSSSSQPNPSSNPTTSDPFNTSTTTSTTSTFLDLPPHLLETRHNIVHRHLPPLFVLKQAAQDSLKWLWDAYWSLLDVGLAGPGKKNLAERDSSGSSNELRDTIQGILKTYLRARKAELLSSSSGGARKTRAKASSNPDSQSASAAADTALFSLTTLPTEITSPQIRTILLDLLVLSQDRLILPSVKRGVSNDNSKGANMAGAFLLWGPLVLLLSSSSSSSSSSSFSSSSPPPFLNTFTSSLLAALDASHASNDETAAHGLHAWIVHLLTSTEFSSVRQRCRVVQTTLEACFTVPSGARLAVADAILEHGDVGMESGEREMWVAVLEAARREGGQGEGEGGEVEREEDAMQIDSHDIGVAPESSRVVKAALKQCGPQKYVGLWRPRPIGWVSGD